MNNILSVIYLVIIIGIFLLLGLVYWWNYRKGKGIWLGISLGSPVEYVPKDKATKLERDTLKLLTFGYFAVVIILTVVLAGFVYLLPNEYMNSGAGIIYAI